MSSPGIVQRIDRREFALRLLQLAAALALPARAFADVARGAFDVVVQRDVMVAMRDGVQLATDIYLPANKGRVLAKRAPVILERTPYGKSGRTRRHASEEIGLRNVAKRNGVPCLDCESPHDASLRRDVSVKGDVTVSEA